MTAEQLRHRILNDLETLDLAIWDNLVGSQLGDNLHTMVSDIAADVRALSINNEDECGY